MSRPGRVIARSDSAYLGAVAEVSVIVPAHDAGTTIGRTLAALAAQRFEGGYEVVVVDDASSDATAVLAERAGARLVRQAPRAGPAAARNAGVAAASAALLAFTDADCEPAPTWLAAGAAALRDADLVTGPIAPAPGAAVGPFDRTLRVSGPSPLFESANLFVRRATFERVGAFARLPGVAAGHFGEDALFGWRARRTGARVAYAPGALVHHAVFRRGARGYVAERARLRYFPALVAAAPELRGELPGRVFLSRRTAAFDLALAGALAAAGLRSPWPLLAVAPYARRHLRAAPRASGAYLAGDLVGAAALVYGSAAARTLLV
jgi:glycosyltransferase involved in cell wall biosynthesis